MNYSDSFRRGTPRRRYSERADDSYETGASHLYSTEPSARNYDDESYRPGPSSAPPRRQDPPRRRTDEDEEIIIETAGPSVPRASDRRTRVDGEPEILRIDPGPSMPRPPDRRARVDDEPEILHVDPGPTSRPSNPDRSPDDIEMQRRILQRETSAYGRPPAPPQGRYYTEAADEIYIPRRPSGRGEVPLIYGYDERRRTSGVPPPPPPPGSRYVPLAYTPERRRTVDRMAPPPPPYRLPIIEERDSHRQSHRASSRPTPLRPPPAPRPVPLGVVQPSPYLVSSYQDPPESVPSHGNGHDLATLAEQPFPNDREKVRNSIVLCVYRHSKKAFDFRFVELRKPSGQRMDRENKPVVTDLQLFRKMRSTYERELRGWIRRFFSFKVLSTVRLLQYGDGLFFRPEQEDDIFSSKFIRIWKDPEDQLDGALDRYEWNRWLLQQKNLEVEFDMAIELIEDYVPDRIVFFVGVWLIGIAGLTAAWLIRGGDPGNVSTVMSFVLTFIAAVVALTGIWDWFDGDRSKEIQQRAVMVLPQQYTGHDNLPIFGGPGQKLGQQAPRPPSPTKGW